MGFKHICYVDGGMGVGGKERIQGEINSIFGVLDFCKPSLIDAPIIFQILYKE